MIFVDTAYLFALVSPRDELYSKATSWAAAIPGPMLTTEYVIWEMVNGFSKSADRPLAHALLDGISGSNAWRVIPASSDLYESGLAMHRRHADKNWSLTDCISFVVMREQHIRQALSHDRHFEQAGFEALLRRDPP